MSYEQDLTFELRLRGRDETEIAEILREVQAHGTDDADLEREFGAPAEYAASFGRSRRRTLGGRITATAVIVAIAWVVGSFGVVLVRRLAFGIEPVSGALLGSPWTLAIAVVIAAAGVLAGFLVDRLSPVRGRTGV
ncbi:hypothetical protein [Microbacterium sp. YJN-G]|uniref:hypothetical protein n=1 Tax=Microbacterium sp. YJN-G TaxID=2763257 RepID=UPI0018785A4E|nr:hypothetical protein [Microbacterium sp. YJN-G]